MGLFGRLKALFSQPQDRSAGALYEASFIRQYPITSNPTVLSILAGIASTLSTLDLGLWQRGAKGSYRVYQHPAALLLANPNPEMTLSQFLYRVAFSYLERGNVYLLKSYGIDGNVIRLDALDASKMQVTRKHVSPFSRSYSYSGSEYSEADILHIADPRFYDGTAGHGALEYGSEVVALDNSLLSYIDAYFRNSLGKRVFFVFPDAYVQGIKNEEQKKAFELSQRRLIDSPALAGILPEKTEIKTIDFTANTESDIASLKERIEREICKLFNYPYFKLSGDYGNNLLNQSIVYYQTCILPICDIFVEALQKLLVAKDAPYMFFKFDYSNLLQPDTETLHRIVRDDVRGMLVTPNEGRKIIGLDAYSDDSGQADKLQKMANELPIDAPVAGQSTAAPA